ncbi:MAG: hypothetical protein FJ011_23020 [Chloroflexi bacterium]|nr:hypothetical protein [Chloroflexota bacterium]
MSKKPVGVQLWTLRKEIAGDLTGTLAKVAQIGYAGVELWFPSWPDVAVLKAACARSTRCWRCAPSASLAAARPAPRRY